MAKLIGILLIFSSLLSIFVLALIELKHSNIKVTTGNVVSSLLKQKPVTFFDYIAGTVFSYSVVSFIVGVIFLFRM